MVANVVGMSQHADGGRAGHQALRRRRRLHRPDERLLRRLPVRPEEAARRGRLPVHRRLLGASWTATASGWPATTGCASRCRAGPAARTSTRSSSRSGGAAPARRSGDARRRRPAAGRRRARSAASRRGRPAGGPAGCRPARRRRPRGRRARSAGPAGRRRAGPSGPSTSSERRRPEQQRRRRPPRAPAPSRCGRPRTPVARSSSRSGATLATCAAPPERGAGGDQPPRGRGRARGRGDHAGGQRAEAGQVGQRGEPRCASARRCRPSRWRRGPAAAGPGRRPAAGRGRRRRRRPRAPPCAAARARRAPWTTGLSVRRDGAVAVGVQPVVAPADGRLTCEDGGAEQHGRGRGRPRPRPPAGWRRAVTATAGPRCVARARASARTSAGPRARRMHTDHVSVNPWPDLRPGR